jgi:D-alanyl-D-alanine dipeptidase
MDDTMNTDLLSVLLQPVPDFSLARKLKPGYREHALLTIGSHDDEPLVPIEEYGIAGQSYYSRPNNATSDPVPGVSETVYVRKTIAEKLAAINYELQKSDVIEKHYGGKVELYVDEGYRPPELQEKLYHEVFPYIISQQHPDWNEAQVLKRRDQMSAKPPEGGTPPPHATGAAEDVKLRYQNPNLQYVSGCEVDMGHGGTDTSLRAHPDYYELLLKLSPDDETARNNRRVFYWVMKGALNGDDSGFVVNPTEWWHWSYGDQMWARLTTAPEAFYSFGRLLR